MNGGYAVTLRIGAVPLPIVPTERDEDTGQFQEEYPREAFVGAIKTLDSTTTSEIAEEVGCSYDLAYRRLNQLAEDGFIRKETVGNSLLWHSN